MKDIFKAFKIVFSNKKYVLLMFLIGFVFFSINVYLPNTSLIFDGSISFGLLVGLFVGGLGTMLLHTLVILILLSLLIGIVISLIIFKIRFVQTHTVGKKTTTLAILLGVAVPGCAACGIGLLPLLGIGGALAYLPFQGTEIGVLSILLLLFALYKISASIVSGMACEV